MSNQLMGTHSPFEQIKQVNEYGSEYWSARDLMKVLGYAKWSNFKTAISKAMESCLNSGQEVSDHFADISNLVDIGSKAKRKVEDYHLSRYACYLVV